MKNIYLSITVRNFSKIHPHKSKKTTGMEITIQNLEVDLCNFAQENTGLKKYIGDLERKINHLQAQLENVNKISQNVKIGKYFVIPKEYFMQNFNPRLPISRTARYLYCQHHAKAHGFTQKADFKKYLQHPDLAIEFARRILFHVKFPDDPGTILFVFINIV
jgi:hypothetical protein